MPVYRLTFRSDDGKTWEREIEAANLPAASSQFHGDLDKLIKIERIDPVTGEFTGGMYN